MKRQSWELLTPEQKAEHEGKRLAKRREEQRRTQMLSDFLNAKTAREKRAVITSFAPYYFIFGTTLSPKSPYETETNLHGEHYEHTEQLSTSL
jgi:hypothetical protein